MTDPLIDKRRMRAAFGAAAPTYHAHAEFQRQVGVHLMECLPVDRRYTDALDLGGGTGFFARQLEPLAERVVVFDIAPGMLSMARQSVARADLVCGDAERMPLAAASMDLVFSNLALQWCQDVNRWTDEVHRILKPSGLFVFSSLGPSTLHELRTAWAMVDPYPHVNEFVSREVLTGALNRAGFTNIRLQSIEHRVSYKSVIHLMKSLKGIGANNALNGRGRGLTGKHGLERLMAAYPGRSDDGDGVFASYEVFYVTAAR